MQLNGAQILIKALQEQGVDTIFGYPGGAVLEIYDVIKLIRSFLVHRGQHMRVGVKCYCNVGMTETLLHNLWANTRLNQ